MAYPEPFIAPMRRLLAPHPPSSPSIALFRDGRPVHMIHRPDIEGRDAQQVAKLLIGEISKSSDAPAAYRPLSRRIAGPLPRLTSHTVLNASFITIDGIPDTS